MDTRQAFSVWRDKHVRPAWKPVCGEAEAAPGGQFGGSPLLSPGEPWPTCKDCGEPMRFFLQIPLATLPAAFEARGEGILQMFYCSTDDGVCETFRAFSSTHLVRLVTAPATTAPHPDGLDPFPLRPIAGWREIADYPHPPEHENLGLVYRYQRRNNQVSVSCKALGIELRDLDVNAVSAPDANVEETISAAMHGDKLGGWPLWVQSVAYPACQQCGRPMRFVMQLDSEDNIPHMFGSIGCGHIMQCPDHPQVLTFAWACG
jgi:uncharacterized protein YwqG